MGIQGVKRGLYAANGYLAQPAISQFLRFSGGRSYRACLATGDFRHDGLCPLPPRFVRARLQPCRTARKIRAALAAEVRFSSCHMDSLSLDGKSPSKWDFGPEGTSGSQRSDETLCHLMNAFQGMKPLGPPLKESPVLFPIRAALCAM
jgi:hypothetical protein